MKARVAVFLSALVVLAAAVPMFAHHSFAAEYDANQPVTFKGVVSKVQWMNPHVWFFVDVKDEKGNILHWDCEAGNPNALARNGWKKDTLKVGDEVSVEGSRAKDGSFTMNARSIKIGDRRIFAGSSGGDER
jgi:hypothetical protein